MGGISFFVSPFLFLFVSAGRNLVFAAKLQTSFDRRSNPNNPALYESYFKPIKEADFLISVFIRYPDGKAKAAAFSNDDGVPQEKRLAELFDKHRIKATFLPAAWLDVDGRSYKILTGQTTRIDWFSWHHNHS